MRKNKKTRKSGLFMWVCLIFFVANGYVHIPAALTIRSLMR